MKRYTQTDGPGGQKKPRRFAQPNFNGNYPAGKASKGPYLERPTKVGTYKPNPLGIYDLHGKVWEWYEDSDEGGPAGLSPCPSSVW